jgi:hypothetical protein
MMLAFLLAAQAAQPQGYTPDEQRAIQTVAECEKRYVDSVPERERRHRGKALIEDTFAACASEEAALRAAFRARFDAESAERLVQMVRGVAREGMRQYLAR